MTREYTNKLFDMIDNGDLLPETVINMCLKFMSEDDVKDMCIANDLFFDEEVDDYIAENDYDDSMDGDFDSGMASAGWGTDEDYGDY